MVSVGREFKDHLIPTPCHGQGQVIYAVICVHSKQYMHSTILSFCYLPTVVGSHLTCLWKPPLNTPPSFFTHYSLSQWVLKVIVCSPSSLGGLGTTIPSWFIYSPSSSQHPLLSHASSCLHPFCPPQTFVLFMLIPSQSSAVHLRFYQWLQNIL